MLLKRIWEILVHIERIQKFGKSGRRKSMGQPANPDSPRK